MRSSTPSISSSLISSKLKLSFAERSSFIASLKNALSRSHSSKARITALSNSKIPLAPSQACSILSRLLRRFLSSLSSSSSPILGLICEILFISKLASSFSSSTWLSSVLSFSSSAFALFSSLKILAKSALFLAKFFSSTKASTKPKSALFSNSPLSFAPKKRTKEAQAELRFFFEID